MGDLLELEGMTPEEAAAHIVATVPREVIVGACLIAMARVALRQVDRLLEEYDGA